jgi:hypothetical protein
MNTEPREILTQIVAEDGIGVVEQPLRVEGLLRDFAGEHRREIAALMACVRLGLAME